MNIEDGDVNDDFLVYENEIKAKMKEKRIKIEVGGDRRRVEKEKNEAPKEIKEEKEIFKI